MAQRLWTGKGLSLPPSVGEWGKASMLNVLICRDLPGPQPHRCSEQIVFSFQLQYHKGNVATCIPVQNPSCAFGRFVIPRYKQWPSQSVKGTGKEPYLKKKKKSLRKDSQRVAVLLLCLPKGARAPSTSPQSAMWRLSMNTISEHYLFSTVFLLSMLPCLSRGFLKTELRNWLFWLRFSTVFP